MLPGTIGNRESKSAAELQPLIKANSQMRAPGIYARHVRLFDLVERHAQIVKVASGFGSTRGAVFSRIGFLLFSDLRTGRIHKWTIPSWEDEPRGGALSVFRDKSGRASGLTFDHQGRLLTCESGPGRLTRTEKDGSITVLAERYADKRLASPHDLVYNIDGSVYFSDLPSRDGPVTDERNSVPAVYRIARTQIPGGRRLEKVSEECERPHGVALGPRHNRLYIADTARRNIRVQPINDDGTLAKGHVFAELPSDEQGGPDGLKTDEAGNVYCAGPGYVWVFGPNGRHLGTIVTPEPPSNCSWGRGFRGLYITAQTSLYFVETKVPGTRTF